MQPADARRYLEDLLARYAGREGMLPGLRALAIQAGVSRETMRRAAAILAREGRLAVTHGSGMRLVQPGTTGGRQPAGLPSGPREHRRQVHSQLRKAVLQGTVGPDGRLPSAKELCHTYGASHRTVARALQHLSAEGLIEPHRKAYRSVYHRTSTRRHSVVLVTGGDREGRVRFPHPRSLTNLLHLQSECMSRGLDLHMVVVSPGGDRVTFPTGDSTVLTRKARHVLGHIVWPSTTFAQLQSVLVERIAPLGSPVAMVDEVTAGPVQTGGHAHTHWFRPAPGRDAGKVVARTLLSQGHRGVAFLLSSPPTFGRDRLEGFRSVYDTVGLGTAVRVITAHPPRVRSLPSLREPAQEAVAKLRGEDPLTWALRTLVNRHPDDLVHLLRDDILAEAFRPGMEQALREGGATAWVGENDAAALAALDFLQNARGRARGPTTVVGFDNSIEALTRGLTSYDFNGRALAASAVNYVLHPRQYRAEPNPVVIPGAVVLRRSTRAATRDTALPDMV